MGGEGEDRRLVGPLIVHRGSGGGGEGERLTCRGRVGCGGWGDDPGRGAGVLIQERLEKFRWTGNPDL